MIIHSIQLLNYRCFADCSINFSPGFNVLVGMNGSGKSSVLECICETLAAGLTHYIPAASGPEPLQHAEDVRIEVIEKDPRNRFEQRFPVAIRATGECLGHHLDWTVHKKTPLAHALVEGKAPGVVMAPSLRAELDPAVTMPVIAFYRAGRDWKLPHPNELAAAAPRASRADAYNKWQDASADGGRLQAWIISESLERARASAESGKSFDAVNDDELAHTNAALVAALDGVKNLHYDLRQKAIVLEWTSSDEERPHIIPLGHLGDGQRAAVCLVTDIARRMCLLNPLLGSEVRSAPGVILIDGLELHLHPGWQRLITRGLRKAFPHVQFITTTHSPQILSELEPGQIILLHKDRTDHPAASYGLDSSRILEEVMGASLRPVEIARLLETVFDALERNDLESAKKESSALSQLAPELPELQRVSALLTRKALIRR